MEWMTLPVVYWIMLGSMNCTSNGQDEWKCESAIMLVAPNKKECFNIGQAYIDVAKERPDTFNARAKCAAVVADVEEEA